MPTDFAERQAELVEGVQINRTAIEALGIAHLRIVGSRATGDATADSDIDLIADFGEAVVPSYFLLARAQRLLEAVLAVKVDLLTGSAFRNVGFKRIIDVF